MREKVHWLLSGWHADSLNSANLGLQMKKLKKIICKGYDINRPYM